MDVLSAKIMLLDVDERVLVVRKHALLTQKCPYILSNARTNFRRVQRHRSSRWVNASA